ncbi:substrate-binding periplasmic protein [Rhodoferax sp.]|uniref:substrate-binding periplasmic protein n=1 Tax=Rhodoferax sp. TaxID=50421 RepID=UPI002766F72E|nr:transporter substrate-binding domain-containing protein [Rhodoferax sp.]
MTLHFPVRHDLPTATVWQQLAAWLLKVTLAAGVGIGLAAQAGEPIKIITEEFPPYNYTEQGKITGLSTDIVNAVLKELKLEGTIQSLPWARAYDTAKSASGVLIYSIGRTPEREPLFKWVGVIAPTDYYLYGLPGRALKIDSLEMAKPYQIGTVNQDVGEQFLLARGFVKGQNLQSSVKYELNYEKLKMGRVDLWIMSELTANHLARQAGDDPAKTLAKVYRINDLSSEGYYMAFGSQTPDATVAKFRKGLEAIKRNGTFDALKKKWL